MKQANSVPKLAYHPRNNTLFAVFNIFLTETAVVGGCDPRSHAAEIRRCRRHSAAEFTGLRG
ncbi:hypothetical protein [Thiohalobacter sp. COW1]|uniref:hypothetical protein n=1 Tax=Thiohalobacter sp. COW1 TaxID=2795687 RepID=UPI00191668C6|nr:hypothetical protein [Thiohalobacter sp. COW1]